MPFDNAKLACILPWETDWTTAVTFVGTSRKVVAGNRRGTLLLWDLPEKLSQDAPPPPVLRLDHHTNAITHLVSTPDGKQVISASYDHTVAVWDIAAKLSGSAKVIVDEETRQKNAKKNGKPIPERPEADVGTLAPAKVFTEHQEWVQAMAISRDGKWLATGDDAGKIIVRSLPTGDIVKRWKTKGWISALAISPDGKMLAVAERIPLDGDKYRALGLWDVASAERTKDLMPAIDKKGFEFSTADFAPDGKLIAVGQGDDEIGDGKAFLLRPDGTKAAETKGAHRYGMRRVRFSADGKHLLTSGRDTTIRVWKTSDGSAVKELGSPRGGQFKDWMCDFAISADERLIAGADMAGAVHVWTI